MEIRIPEKMTDDSTQAWPRMLDGRTAVTLYMLFWIYAPTVETGRTPLPCDSDYYFEPGGG